MVGQKDEESRFKGYQKHRGGGDVKNKRKKIIVKDPCRKERIFFFKERMIGF